MARALEMSQAAIEDALVRFGAGQAPSPQEKGAENRALVYQLAQADVPLEALDATALKQVAQQMGMPEAVLERARDVRMRAALRVQTGARLPDPEGEED